MERFIIFRNSRIHYKTSGFGEAIVLLHGFLEDLTIWERLELELNKRYLVIAIDLPGHGYSENLGYIHSMEMMAEAAEAVIVHLNIKKAVVAGHSMGGYVSLALAKRRPDLFKALCLINSTALADDPSRRLNRDRAIAAVRQNYKTFVRLAIPNLFRPKNRRIFREEINRLKNKALAMDPQSIVAALEGMKRRPDRSEVLKNAPFELLLVIGMKDPILDYDSLIEQTRETEVKVVELPDGHMSFIENKEEFTYILLHFIENL